MNYSRENKEGVEIFHINGDLTTTTSFNLMDDVKLFVESGNKKIIFDLANVSMIDSSGLGVIVYTVKEKCNVKVCINPGNDQVIEMLDLLAINFDHLGYYTSIDNAIQALK